MKKVFDVNKPLSVLYDEWEGCTDCELGVTRNLLYGQQVFGAGDSQGILFLGTTPSREDEREGKIIGGAAGEFLLDLLSLFRIDKYYITNLVACRSCTPQLDEAGQPIMGKGYGSKPALPRYNDQPPVRPQLDACSDRVYEEIYKADPILIVTFGQAPAAFLRGGSFNIKKERGIPEIVDIPGAGQTAVLSPKRKEWTRKVHGQLVSPVARSSVKYLMVPTFDPRETQLQINNEQDGNPYKLFTDDLRRAKQIYDGMQEELHDGYLPAELPTTDDLHSFARHLQAEQAAAKDENNGD